MHSLGILFSVPSRQLMNTLWKHAQWCKRNCFNLNDVCKLLFQFYFNFHPPKSPEQIYNGHNICFGLFQPELCTIAPGTLRVSLLHLIKNPVFNRESYNNTRYYMNIRFNINKCSISMHINFAKKYWFFS